MNSLIPMHSSLSLPEWSASQECHLGPATLTVTDTALIVAVGPSRLILTAEGRSCDYLYHYAPDPRPYRLIPYDCLYRNGERRTWIIRVWQDYNIGRDWIIQRVAAEVARDVAQDDPLQWPINDHHLPGHPCLPSAD